MRSNRMRNASLAVLALLSGCGVHPVGIAGPGGPLKFSHPGLATSGAVYLKVYRASPEGLLVSGLYPDAPVNPDRDPSTVLHRFSFTADPSVHGSYFWRFADGVTLLDGTCQKTDRTGILAAADRQGAISVQFVTFLYADQRDWAPPAVHVFSRVLSEPTDCSNAVMSDPAFAAGVAAAP